MPHQDHTGERPHYDETTDPSNPPNAVLQPEVRRTALRTYMGIIIATFLIAGALLLIFTMRGGDGSVGGVEPVEPTTMGTSGERQPREGTPGGFDPQPDHDSTQDELEHRGAGGARDPNRD